MPAPDFLLPVGEKVSAKPTDKGAHRSQAIVLSASRPFLNGWRARSSGSFEATFSPRRDKY